MVLARSDEDSTTTTIFTLISTNTVVAANSASRLLKHWKKEIEAQAIEKIGFIFPKMDLLWHFSNALQRFVCLPQYSTYTGEIAYKKQIKEGYSHSNQVNYCTENLNKYRRLHIMKICKLHLISIDQRNINSSFEAQESPEIQEYSQWICIQEILECFSSYAPVDQSVANKQYRQGLSFAHHNTLSFWSIIHQSIKSLILRVPLMKRL